MINNEFNKNKNYQFDAYENLSNLELSKLIFEVISNIKINNCNKFKLENKQM